MNKAPWLIFLYSLIINIKYPKFKKFKMAEVRTINPRDRKQSMKKSPTPKLAMRKESPKSRFGESVWFRVVMVFGYLVGVCFLAISLSVYYGVFWEPFLTTAEQFNGTEFDAVGSGSTSGGRVGAARG